MLGVHDCVSCTKSVKKEGWLISTLFPKPQPYIVTNAAFWMQLVSDEFITFASFVHPSKNIDTVYLNQSVN